MRNGKKITMKEISSIANVSLATVSRVIHSPELVRPETRQQVLLSMEQNNYVYDANAADLSRRRSTVIGVTIPTTKDAGFASSTMMIQDMAQKKGYSVIISNTQFDSKLELQMLRQFQERRVSGVILTGFSLGQEKTVVKLVKSGIPCVVIWEKIREPEINYVGFDNLKASRSMTEYLISLNHRRIGFIVGPYTRIGRVKKRLDGYQQALKRHNISYDSKLVIETEITILDGKEATERLLSLPDPPTAIFLVSDVMALGAMAAVRNKGLSVPDDISIAGFDDIEYAAYLCPSLTSIRVPAEKMGYLSAKILFEMIEAENPIQSRQYCLDTELIIRESCRKLNVR